MPTTTLVTTVVVVAMMVVVVVMMVVVVVMMVLLKDLVEDISLSAMPPTPIITVLHDLTKIGTWGEQLLGCDSGRLSSEGDTELHEEPVLR
jgi:hypothetical protein